MPPQGQTNSAQQQRYNDEQPTDSCLAQPGEGCDELDIEDFNVDDTVVEDDESFFQVFVKSKGPPQIVILIMLLAMGFGSTVGVVPAVMTDRYARLNHDYDDDQYCQDYSQANKPEACLLGSADAQNAVAMSNLVSNGFTFFTSSLVGSFSDQYGRKGVLVIGVTMSVMSPLILTLMQLNPQMSPIYYYTLGALQGLVNWIAIALSALSDVMPPRWRAPSFGLLLAGFSLGFAMAPGLALLLGHLRVTIMSFCFVFTGLLVIIFFFPETLSPESALKARTARLVQFQQDEAENESNNNRSSILTTICNYMYRPIWELSILNRNRLFRLLSSLAFFSGIVSSADQTLLIYYVEERLAFTDKDIAIMFMILGLFGIFVQGVVLRIVNEAIGERLVILLCFAIGSFHNVLYGIAHHKVTIFVAVAVGSFTGMAFPTISAIKANNVNDAEQGRIQGALYSLQAVASALGPLVLRSVYHYTKDGAFLGPGSMFIVAAGLYLIAVYCAYLLPDKANSIRRRESSNVGNLEIERTSSSPLLL